MTKAELIQLIHRGVREQDLSIFYTSKEWRRLRRDVRREFKDECQQCKANGYYVKAESVHHVKTVRKHPELALNRTYQDADGMVKINLLPLCDECHKEIHIKLKKTEAVTQERWD